MEDPQEERCGHSVENVEHDSGGPIVRQQVREERCGRPAHFRIGVFLFFSVIVGQQQRDSPSTGQARTRLLLTRRLLQDSRRYSREKETNRKKKDSNNS